MLLAYSKSLVQMGDMRYVDEWVDYHLALGFDTIYMVDNTEDFELQPWHQGQRDEYRIRVPGNRIRNHADRLCGERQSHVDVVPGCGRVFCTETARLHSQILHVNMSSTSTAISV